MPIVLTIIIGIGSIVLAVWPKIQKYINLRKDEKEEKAFDKMIDDFAKEYEEPHPNQ